MSREPTQAKLKETSRNANVYMYINVYVYIYIYVKGKGKVIPLQARCGPDGG